jgi:predicted RNase H-like nuclease (RuvC/YqgF family)
LLTAVEPHDHPEPEDGPLIGEDPEPIEETPGGSNPFDDSGYKSDHEEPEAYDDFNKRIAELQRQIDELTDQGLADQRQIDYLIRQGREDQRQIDELTAQDRENQTRIADLNEQLIEERRLNRDLTNRIVPFLIPFLLPQTHSI